MVHILSSPLASFLFLCTFVGLIVAVLERCMIPFEGVLFGEFLVGRVVNLCLRPVGATGFVSWVSNLSSSLLIVEPELKCIMPWEYKGSLCMTHVPVISLPDALNEGEASMQQIAPGSLAVPRSDVSSGEELVTEKGGDDMMVFLVVCCLLQFL